MIALALQGSESGEQGRGRVRTELDLMRTVALTGDVSALAELSSRLHKCVHFVLNQSEWFTSVSADRREDIVQECLTRLLGRMRKGFDGVEAQFKTYLYKVVYSVTVTEASRNTGLSSLDQEFPTADGSSRRLRDQLMGDVSPWGSAGGDPGDAGEGMARADREGRLAAALATLGPTDREALRLFEVEGQSTRDIAQRLRVSEGSVSVRLHRARDRMLRAYLRTYAGAPVSGEEEWITTLIGRMAGTVGAALTLWWREGGSARQVAARLGLPEDRCRDLLARGKAALACLAEETPRAS